MAAAGASAKDGARSWRAFAWISVLVVAVAPLFAWWFPELVTGKAILARSGLVLALPHEMMGSTPMDPRLIRHTVPGGETLLLGVEQQRSDQQQVPIEAWSGLGIASYCRGASCFVRDSRNHREACEGPDHAGPIVCCAGEGAWSRCLVSAPLAPGLVLTGSVRQPAADAWASRAEEVVRVLDGMRLDGFLARYAMARQQLFDRAVAPILRSASAFFFIAFWLLILSPPIFIVLASIVPATRLAKRMRQDGLSRDRGKPDDAARRDADSAGKAGRGSG